MATLTELLAAMVVQSSAAAYSHFGVTLEPIRLEAPAVVERTGAAAPRTPLKVEDCPAPPVQLRGKSLKA